MAKRKSESVKEMYEEERAEYVRELEAIQEAAMNVTAAGQDENRNFIVDEDSMFALRRALGKFARESKKRIALERPTRGERSEGR